MELRRWNDILAIKTNEGRVVGFHARNLEVAELSEEVWGAISIQDSKDEAFEQLSAWASEDNLDALTPTPQRVRSITVNMTQICNLHCTYCAAGGNGTYGEAIRKISVEKTIPQLKFLLSKLEAGETFQITYLGGEPLLYPEGIRLLGEYLNEEAARLNIQIRHRIVTNGTLITDENLSLLKALKAHVSVSLDGAPQINDQRRPMNNGKGSTSVVAEGLRKLSAAKNELGSLMISGVFGKGNFDLVSAYKFYSEFNVDKIEFNLDHEDIDLESAKVYSAAFAEVLKLAKDRGGEKSLRQINFVDKIFSNLDNQSRVQNYCGAGKSFVMIDAKNNMYPCVWSPNKASEAVGTGSVFFDSKLAEFEKPLMEKQGCNTCWARFLCGGGCMYVHEQATGSKHIPAEVFCFQSRSLISQVIMYYQEFRAV